MRKSTFLRNYPWQFPCRHEANYFNLATQLSSPRSRNCPCTLGSPAQLIRQLVSQCLISLFQEVVNLGWNTWQACSVHGKVCDQLFFKLCTFKRDSTLLQYFSLVCGIRVFPIVCVRIRWFNTDNCAYLTHDIYFYTFTLHFHAHGLIWTSRKYKVRLRAWILISHAIYSLFTIK